MRERARAEKRAPGYDGRWRDRDPSEAPDGVSPVIRLKTPLEGSTTIQDDVQGEVTVNNDQLDDLILLPLGCWLVIHSVPDVVWQRSLAKAGDRSDLPPFKWMSLVVILLWLLIAMLAVYWLFS